MAAPHRAQVYVINQESGVKEIFGPFTYKDGDTFGHIRPKFSDIFSYSFQFRDAMTHKLIPIPLESHFSVEHNQSEIIICPTSGTSSQEGLVRPPSTGPCSGQTILGSSNASNVPNSKETSNHSYEDRPYEEAEQDRAWSDDESPTTEPGLHPGVQTEPSSIPDVEPATEQSQVSLESKLMPKPLMKIWALQSEALVEYMKVDCRKASRFQVRTWDDKITWNGVIYCYECARPYSGANVDGQMDKTSITTCFANFKSKHLSVNRHKQALQRRLGSTPVDVAQKHRDAIDAEIVADRSLLHKHVAMVQHVNEVEADSPPTFTIKGDLHADPLDFSRLKLYCTICCNHMTFVSKQCNLQRNLEAHCSGNGHLDAKERRQRISSGAAILSGTAGRPRLVDSRDVRQKTIEGFFNADAKAASGSGAGSKSGACAAGQDQGIMDNLSLLCWGLWFETVKYGEVHRPIKGILDDQLRIDGMWYGEPMLKGEVWCLTSQSTLSIQGAFRHRHCSRVSQGGGGFENLICQHCYSIRGENDFRCRVLREFSASEKRGTRGTGRGRRLGYLTMPEVVLQAGKYRATLLKERKRQTHLRHQLLMAKRRVPKISELCSESANRKDVLKFCNDIILAHNTNAFGGKPALWDMFKDMASNLTRTKRGYRFSEGSKMLGQALLLHGGRRVINCLAENGISPSLNTLQRDRRGMSIFRAGIHPEQFTFLAEVYSSLKERLGIKGPVPCYLAEDETTVKRTVRWLPQSDTLLGFCGDAENHKCMVGLEIPVGEGESGLKSITDAFDGKVMGHQARCIIVNPLCEDFPRLCLLATITCNKFDAPWVREQWNVLKRLWDTHCLQKVGPLLGHASDGDSRRRKLMLQDYTGRGKSGPRKDVGWEGWPLTHAMVTIGDKVHAYGIHDQDFIHNGKKLINALDSITRRLQMGSSVAQFNHVQVVANLYDMVDHGLTKVDLARSDRQNWASAQRLCSRKLIPHMRMTREREDHKAEQTLATEMYLSICADYLDIFMNTSLTLRQRVVLCGKVGFILRLWRLWCFHGNHTVGGHTQRVSFTECCIPMQSFLDIQMSVHAVVFLIIQFRENFPCIPVPLSRTGSDACEQFFSKVGGMKGHERNYDIAELVDCATSLNRMAALDTSGKVVVGKSHKKHRNIWMNLQVEKLPPADQTDYSGIKSNAEVVQALKEGLMLAQEVCAELDMKPSMYASARAKEWWLTPWITENKGNKFGGWCEINVDGLEECADVLEIEEGVVEAPVSRGQGHGTIDDLPIAGIDPILDDGADDVEIAEAGIQAVMQSLCCQIENERSSQGSNSSSSWTEVKPTVTWQGQEMYKSTVVSGYVGNPHLSKDRLNQVKETFYVNSQVDKAKSKEGVPTMMMQVGSDCGVVFFEEREECNRETRSKEVVKALKRKRGGANNHCNSSKKPRGKAVPVESTSAQGSKYMWWLGRVQNIIRKYGKKWHRCRVGIDLLDRPEPGTCRVCFNWFSPMTTGRKKFKYNVCDPQWIDLECVISNVKLSVDPSLRKVFQLDADDLHDLDDFVKNRVT